LSHREHKPNGQPFGLTRQELIIIRLLCEGLTNVEIGARLKISYETVRSHITNLSHKLGVSSRMEVAVLAVSQNLVTTDANPEVPGRADLLAELEVVHGKIEKYVRRSRLLVQQLAGVPKPDAEPKVWELEC